MCRRTLGLPFPSLPGFDPDPDNNCVFLLEPNGNMTTLLALSATENQIQAVMQQVAPNAQPGPTPRDVMRW